MKKLLGTAACLAVIGLSLPAFADQALLEAKTTSMPISSEISLTSATKPLIAMEKAQKIAEALLGISKEFKKESINYEDFPGRKVWTIRWTTNQSFKNASISASIDADTGELRNYYYEDPSVWEPRYDFSSDLTREEALKIARKFVQKCSPKYFSALKEIPQPEFNEYYAGMRPAKRYRFKFARLVNGIPFDDDGAWVEVLENGKIVNYNFNWLKLSSSLPTKKVSGAEANKIFNEKAGLNLAYIKDYSKPQNNPSQAPTKLVYMLPDGFNFYIDAESGELKDYSGQIINKEYLENMKSSQVPRGDGKFYIGDSKIAKEDALKIVEEKITIPEGYNVTSTEFRKDYFSNRPVWSFRYAKQQPDKEGFNYEVTVAADNGEIVGYAKYKYNGPIPLDDKNLLSHEEAQKIAEDFINKIAPERLKVVKLDPQVPGAEAEVKLKQIPDRWYHFSRYANGVVVYGEGINITIDAEKGEVTNYSLQFSVGNFAMPKNIMPKEKIMAVFTSKSALQLAYFRVYKPGIDYGLPGIQPEIVLGYRLQPDFPRQYDAITGKPITNGMGSSVEKPSYPKDIAKHRYQKAITKLVELKIMGGRSANMFYPDQAISKVEFIKALLAAKNLMPDYSNSKLPFKDVSSKAWYAPYLRTALAKGIITASNEFKPQAKLTKEDASVMAIRALGYDKLAKLDIYKKPLKLTVKKENVGYAALAQGLKLIPETASVNALTRGESAQLLLNVMMVKQ